MDKVAASAAQYPMPLPQIGDAREDLKLAVGGRTGAGRQAHRRPLALALLHTRTRRPTTWSGLLPSNPFDVTLMNATQRAVWQALGSGRESGHRGPTLRR
ncbi:MAG: hypothetical protein JWR64_1874 [Marmoricola sp.]|nr:hypothetical protein [Marmoricola sp.]